MNALHVKDLDVYQRAFELQQLVFVHTKTWPLDEAYSLVGQIRRASRGIGACLSQAWGRRNSARAFQTKLIDADAEVAETRHWLRTAAACHYLDTEAAVTISRTIDVVGELLAPMIKNPEQFCPVSAVSAQSCEPAP